MRVQRSKVLVEKCRHCVFESTHQDLITVPKIFEQKWETILIKLKVPSLFTVQFYETTEHKENFLSAKVIKSLSKNYLFQSVLLGDVCYVLGGSGSSSMPTNSVEYLDLSLPVEEGVGREWKQVPSCFSVVPNL